MIRLSLFILLNAFYLFSQVPSISQDSLKSLLVNGSPYDFLLIDVRPDYFITMMIGSDDCKPYNLEWPEQFQKEFGKIGKDQVVFLYCKSSSNSISATKYVQNKGYTNVYSVGGTDTWKGPTVSPANMLPVSELPEPSMKARCLSVIYYDPRAYVKTVSTHSLLYPACFNMLITKTNYYYNLQGQRQHRVKNTGIKLTKSISGGK